MSVHWVPKPWILCSMALSFSSLAACHTAFCRSLLETSRSFLSPFLLRARSHMKHSVLKSVLDVDTALVLGTAPDSSSLSSVQVDFPSRCSRDTDLRLFCSTLFCDWCNCHGTNCAIAVVSPESLKLVPFHVQVWNWHHRLCSPQHITGWSSLLLSDGAVSQLPTLAGKLHNSNSLCEAVSAWLSLMLVPLSAWLTVIARVDWAMCFIHCGLFNLHGLSLALTDHWWGSSHLEQYN